MVYRLATFVSLLLVQTRETDSFTVTDLTEHTWQGRFGTFAVPRERVAAKLAELRQSSCHKDFLTLPNDPVLQDLIQPDEHIVAIAYGKINATHFKDSLPVEIKSKYETEADTVQFYIPMLTGTDPDAEPIYKLSLGSFVATDKPFLQPNVAIPTEQVDSINVSSDGLVITDGCDRLEIVWSTLGACETPLDFIIQGFEEYDKEVTVSSQTIPNYPFCDEPGGDQFTFCVDYDIVNCACQVWTHGGGKSFKEDFFSVQYITSKFEKVSLLTDGPQDALVTEYWDGFNTVAVRQPCIA